MLSTDENIWNIKALKFLSVCALLPIRINTESGKLDFAISGVKRAIWKLLFALCGIHCLYINGRLFQSLLYQDYVPEHVTLHVILASFSILTFFLEFSFAIVHKGTAATIFNEISAFSCPASNLHRWASSAAGARRKLTQLTKQELLIVALPAAIAFAIVFAVIIFALQYDAMYLLYSAVSTSAERNDVLLVITLGVEGGLIAMRAASLYFVVHLHLLTFELAMANMKNMRDRVKFWCSGGHRGEIEGHRTYMECRKLQFLLKLFNESNGWIVFCLKQEWMYGSIILGFSAIRHFSRNYVLGAFNATIAFYAIICYCVIFDKAFRIPQDMANIKASIITAIVIQASISKDAKVWNEKDILVRRMRSIQDPYVRVGSFMAMERNSSLNFIDYVARFIANLLVSYGT